jgi:hypothetical protein
MHSAETIRQRDISDDPLPASRADAQVTLNVRSGYYSTAVTAQNAHGWRTQTVMRAVSCTSTQLAHEVVPVLVGELVSGRSRRPARMYF